MIDYFAGIWIERSEGKKRKQYLLISIISTVLVLFVFKYYNFFIDNYNGIANLIGWNYSIDALAIILPIGLSFHTFQSLSYVIEVYRGNQKAETNFGIYSLYVMYYPQLVAGPIERPQNLLHQFKRENNFKFQNFHRGIRLIIVGFFMKLVVADRLGIYVDSVYNNADKHGGLSLALATFFFAFQIYCDFAGYSSIAIGASRVMGISLMTNFRRPYLSKTVSEFWRRWHISLSTWFKDYVFISMGGSRVKTKSKLYFNLMVTFLISGFWHGASWTFVIWGGLNGLYLIFEQMIHRVHTFLASVKFFTVFRIIYVFVLICIAWIFFRSNSIGDALMITKKIFTSRGKLFTPPDPEILIYCFLAVFMIIANEVFYEMIYAKRRIKRYTVLNNAYMIFLIICIILLGVFDGGQFIYFQF
ncbi:MBOAT family O-acyltransferase [Pseudochryseolinea flava]|uniref:MBOAT family O-acyltransferase n=1 Tax=Pseudochryseolinea flava TaxID=2059302 RepID=UPI002936D96A|nr:MBOAT family O-acyltransferase [Pseudochryseolinea flava]